MREKRRSLVAKQRAMDQQEAQRREQAQADVAALNARQEEVNEKEEATTRQADVNARYAALDKAKDAVAWLSGKMNSLMNMAGGIKDWVKGLTMRNKICKGLIKDTEKKFESFKKQVASLG